MAYILFRDSVAGHALRRVFHWPVFQHLEDKPDFTSSAAFQNLISPKKADDEKSETREANSSATRNGTQDDDSGESQPTNGQSNIQPPTANVSDSEPIIVGWYGDDDPQNPKNWPVHVKLWTLFVIYLYCFSVYMGASIVTPAEPYLQKQFNITQQVSSLALSLYVLGYGIGPLFWSPLSEMPVLGRNAPYIPTMAIFVLLNIPAALVDNTAGLVVVRFLQGFFGSPVLSIAAGSHTDILAPTNLVYGLVAFQAVCFMSPGLGPLLSSFLIKSTSWRWTFWELICISGFTFLVMVFTLPETSSDAILLHRARRIRHVTCDQRFCSQSENAQRDFSFLRKLRNSLLTPVKLTFLDPAVAYANVYVALNYGIYYSFFESFPLIYEGVYGFSPQITSVMFTSIIVAAIIAVILYIIYLEVRFKPRMKKGNFVMEDFLLPTLGGGAALPIGLFLFAWTARTSINWIVPTIGVVFYCAGNYNVFRGVLTYVIFTHPKYTASITAGNGFFRSALAAGAIHFSQPLFENLGIARGVSVLAGLTFGFWLIAFPLWHYGARLRQRSTFVG